MGFEVNSNDDENIGVKRKTMSQVLKLSVNVGEGSGWKTPATVRGSGQFTSRDERHRSRGF